MARIKRRKKEVLYREVLCEKSEKTPNQTTDFYLLVVATEEIDFT